MPSLGSAFFSYICSDVPHNTMTNTISVINMKKTLAIISLLVCMFASAYATTAKI